VYTTYLVPLDGSPFAERALPYALVLARAARGRLILLRVLPRTATGQTDGGAMEALAESVRAVAPDVVVETRMWDAAGGEDAGLALAAAAAGLDADAIVMATHGRGGPWRWIRGGVADRVLACAETPVVVIPPGADRAWLGGGLRRVLVPLDGSPFAEAALVAATAVPRTPEVEILLLRVVEPDADGPGAGLAEARRYLAGIADRLGGAGRRFRPLGRIGPAAPAATATAIAAVSAESGADLIVMATHGRSGRLHRSLGGVAAETLARAGVPALLVRPVGPAPVAVPGMAVAAAGAAERGAPPAEATRQA
jgi:nucleotide-binding universal stress UspA family protein